MTSIFWSMSFNFSCRHLLAFSSPSPPSWATNLSLSTSSFPLQLSQWKSSSSKDTNRNASRALYLKEFKSLSIKEAYNKYWYWNKFVFIMDYWNLFPHFVQIYSSIVFLLSNSSFSSFFMRCILYLTTSYICNKLQHKNFYIWRSHSVVDNWLKSHDKKAHNKIDFPFSRKQNHKQHGRVTFIEIYSGKKWTCA